MAGLKNLETKPSYENTPKLSRHIPNFYRNANDNSRLGAKFTFVSASGFWCSVKIALVGYVRE